MSPLPRGRTESQRSNDGWDDGRADAPFAPTTTHCLRRIRTRARRQFASATSVSGAQRCVQVRRAADLGLCGNALGASSSRAGTPASQCDNLRLHRGTGPRKG